MLKQKYELKVFYKGETYSPLSVLYFNNFLRGATVSLSEDNKPDTFNLPISIIANCEETNDDVILNVGYLLFCKEDASKEEYSFKEDFFKKLIFNKSKKEGIADNIDELIDLETIKTNYGIELNSKEVLNLDSVSFSEFTSYIEKVIPNNEVVKNYITNNFRTLCDDRYSFQPGNFKKETFIFLFNLCRLLTTNLLEIEKLISSENEYILKSTLNRKGAILEKGKKLSKVINLPKFALPYLKEHNLERSEQVVRDIANEFDGNTVKIIFDFFDSFETLNKYKKVSKYDNYEAKRHNFLENCYYMMKRDYKIIPLLNYALRQEMYWTEKSSNVFGEPFEQMKTFVDYVRMCEKHEVSYEKYPQDLERSHDIALANFKELGNAEKDKSFVDSIKNNYDFESTEVGSFTFLAPKNIQDLVLEGNSLHHCVGSYTDNIINNISHIYFMRFTSDTTTSYITVELNPKTCDLVEAKENYNKDISDDEALKAIKKFVKSAKIKRGLIIPKTTSEKEEE